MVEPLQLHLYKIRFFLYRSKLQVMAIVAFRRMKRPVLHLVFILCAASVISGQCFSENDDQGSSSTPSTPNQQTFLKEIKSGPLTISFRLQSSDVTGPSGRSSPEPSTDDNIDSLSKGSTEFALALFKNILVAYNSPTDNVCLSPISIWSALILTYLGSRNNTKVEFENVLKTGDFSQKQVINLYQEIIDDYLLHNATSSANYTFNLANKLFFDQTVQLRNCLLEYIRADLEKLDFRNAPEASRDTINDWVESQTNNKIVDLIPSGSIDSSTRIVIVNAAYLKGIWETQFLSTRTTKEDFYVQSNNTTKVDTMHHDRKLLQYGQSLQLQCTAIELLYSGDEISMTILLPDLNSSVDNLVSKLTASNIQDIHDTMANVLVNLALPKFRIVQQFSLKSNLQELGIKDAFISNKADLSGFTNSTDLYISSIAHQTYIDVNEIGTEAAAATAVILTTTSVISGTPVNFLVNRPFVFVIRQRKLNILLFAGVVRNPSAI